MSHEKSIHSAGGVGTAFNNSCRRCHSFDVVDRVFFCFLQPLFISSLKDVFFVDLTFALVIKCSKRLSSFLICTYQSEVSSLVTLP
jgi:hypothetical protein